MLPAFRRRMSSSLSPPPPLCSLRGTVQPHSAYILLHTPNQPPQTFPPRGPVSQVQKRLQLGAVKWGGVVNWVWQPPITPCSRSCTATCTSTEVEELPSCLTASTPPPPPSPQSLQEPATPETGEPQEEIYRVTAFSKKGRLEIPQVTLSNVEEVEERIRRFAVEDSESDGIGEESDGIGEEPEVHVFVCTHTARDCRCGVRGGAFSRAIYEQIVQRGAFLGDGEKKVRLRLGEVGHVGGHQYAPNVLIYPYGDWYGVLDPEQVATILDELNAVIETRGIRPLGKTDVPLLTSVKDHWRGRMGMSKGEQAALAQSLDLGPQSEDVDVKSQG